MSKIFMKFIKGAIMEWKDKVKYARIIMKMTQLDLSKATGISAVTIARWETGKIKPQSKQIGKFIEFCNKNKIEFNEESLYE